MCSIFMGLKVTLPTKAAQSDRRRKKYYSSGIRLELEEKWNSSMFSEIIGHDLKDRVGGSVAARSAVSLIWSDPVNRCTSVGLLLLSLSLFVSSFEDSASSSRGRIERRLISLIFAGRNRIIMIRRELPLTRVASPAEPVA